MIYDTKEFYRTLSNRELNAAADRMEKQLAAARSWGAALTAAALRDAARAVLKEREES